METSNAGEVVEGDIARHLVGYQQAVAQIAFYASTSSA